MPSSRSIFKSYSRCGASMEALLLLNTSANSWYCSGTAERSTASEVEEAARSVASNGSVLRLYEVEPLSLHNFANAERLTNSMDRAWQSDAFGVIGVEESTGGMSSGCDRGVRTEVGLVCLEVQNEILLFTQSINRLWQVSQFCPRTMEQVPSNEVM